MAYCERNFKTMKISEVGGDEFEKTKGISIRSQRYRVPKEREYDSYKYGRSREELFFFERFGILARVSTYHENVTIWKIDSNSFDSNTPKKKMNGKEEKIFLECDIVTIQKSESEKGGGSISIHEFTKWNDRSVLLVGEYRKHSQRRKEKKTRENHMFFFNCFKITNPTSISFKTEIDIGFDLVKVVKLKGDTLLSIGDFQPTHASFLPKIPYYCLVSITNEENVELESEPRIMKYKIRLNNNLVVDSKVHHECSYYLSNFAMILFNFITDKLIRFIFGNPENPKIVKERYYFESIFQFRPFITNSGKEYLISGGNFRFFYVNDTHKENELIHKIDVLEGIVVGHRSCWHTCLIDDAYFVCGNHDKTVSFSHIDPCTGYLRKIDEVEITDSYNFETTGIRKIRLIEKKKTQLRIIVQYSLGKKSDFKDYFTVITLSSVPFLRPNKFVGDDEYEKERMEYVLDKLEDYFTIDQMREFGIEIIISQNFRLKLSKFFLFM